MFDIIKKSLAIASGLCMNVIVFADTSADIQVVFENSQSADSIIALYPDLHLERIIPRSSDPATESRHRESGLDLWYVAKAGSNKKAKRAANSLGKCDGVRGIYESQSVKLPEAAQVSESCNESQPFSLPSHFAQSSHLSSPQEEQVNDPLYPRQWHYDRINLKQAWELEQGKRDVVVAVLDGWIDHTHPDLAPNMWVNEAELNGLPGVDDDGNGYVDDIYGFNADSSSENFDAHGTHVAGTVAAVNNNGIGVCGIAGGDGQQTGVRIMSIGLSAGSHFVPDWLVARGFVYAADNGAVISQNSWESLSPHQSPIIGNAISYFMENAGNYPGSPMKGGLVVFAAGNDHTDIPNSPLNGQLFNRNRFLTVGAVSSELIRSSFSNYGWWVDIAAPGGEQDGVSVLSTFPDEMYGLDNGTSMACPHVSGVAALVVSKFGGPELTPEMVRERLITTATPIESYQAGFFHEKETSLGIVNAYVALLDKAEEKPGMPGEFSIDSYNVFDCVFSWIMPADSNGNPPALCRIYANDPDIPIIIVKTGMAEVGRRYEFFNEIDGLTRDAQFTIEAVDYDGNVSDRSPKTAKTDRTGQLRIINPYHIDNFVVYKPSEEGFEESFGERTLRFPTEGGMKSIEIIDLNNIVKGKITNGVCVIRFEVSDDTPTGTFPFSINLHENLNPDNRVSLDLTYTVKNALCKNGGPVSKTGGKDLTTIKTAKRKGTFTLAIGDYLTHPWNSTITVIDNESTIKDDFFDFEIKSTVKDGVMTVDYDFNGVFPYASTQIMVEAMDEYLKTSSFRVLIDFKEEAGISDIPVDHAAMKKGIHTLQGLRLDCDVEYLPAGIYIIDGEKTAVTNQSVK